MLLEIVVSIPKIIAIIFTVPGGFNFDSRMFWTSLTISALVLLFALLIALILTVIMNLVTSSGQHQNNKQKTFDIMEGLNYQGDSASYSQELFNEAVKQARNECGCRCHSEQMFPGMRCLDCYGELCDEGTQQ